MISSRVRGSRKDTRLTHLPRSKSSDDIAKSYRRAFQRGYDIGLATGTSRAVRIINEGLSAEWINNAREWVIEMRGKIAGDVK